MPPQLPQRVAMLRYFGQLSSGEVVDGQLACVVGSGQDGAGPPLAILDVFEAVF
eukprot:CAMPEP_0201281428 /NCGR_PEP_ID=MMETSP1317-20130820/2729_1 /ASSEMBLY_ACC=CAM_ASM_000770 /TAXON_ID=187299 /ORGANISM="Undescribed Undescribed, Strain Undescribed" /LENGTH=53 /DNA_ID=CAMNT_0047591195 /DNA_START=398 /DNA_END=559 /DNA_ORIENTATION=-